MSGTYGVSTGVCDCQREAGTLTPSAVFCPSCGRRLWPAINSTGDSVVALLSHGLRRLLPATHIEPEKPSNLTPAAVVVGYGRALFSLGWRYERGGEVRRNLTEAVRCYRKSARLGNADAIGRLIPPDSAPPRPVLPLPET